MAKDIDLDRLRWEYRGRIWRDVTCENCHTAVYRPKEHGLCPACEEALMEDMKVCNR